MATTAEPQGANSQEAMNKPTTAKGWGTDAPDQPLRPMEFERRALRPNDVAIRITHAGICHSDLHTARNDWGGTRYPVIPGHEIVGTVTAVGDEVTRHRVGDTLIVGRDDDAGDATRRQRASIHVLDHRAASDVGERFSWEPGRLVPCRDDGDDRDRTWIDRGPGG